MSARAQSSYISRPLDILVTDYYFASLTGMLMFIMATALRKERQFGKD
jgi:hypothetical protein